MEIKTSYHFSVERAKRLDYIDKTVGFGKPIAETIFKSPTSAKPSRSILTSTGVIICQNIDSGKIITAHLASVKQACAIWYKCHNGADIPAKYMQNFRIAEKFATKQPK